MDLTNLVSKSRYKQGFFRPKNPKKYKGDINDIVFRSSWEYSFMEWCDSNPSVVEWISEGVVIPYIKPTDNRFHRYFIDFRIKIETINGLEEHLVEIKPYAQTQKPKGGKVYRGNLPKVWETFLTNQAKWEAAQKYASQKGLKFTILDEYDLGLKKKESSRPRYS